MRLHISDPGHASLRRAARTTVAVVVALLLALWLIPGTPGVVMAAFGVFALVATADFGGSVRRRVDAFVGCGLAGVSLVVIGAAISGSVVAIIVVTFLVTATLSYLAVLRGTVASAVPAVTIVYIVAVMVTGSLDNVGVMLAGLAIALSVGVVATLLVFPRRSLRPITHACAAALRALADLQARRAAGEPPDREALRSAREGIRAAYLGNPFRSTGLHRSDRALLVLVGQLQTLLTGILRADSDDSVSMELPPSGELTEASSTALAQLADAIESGTGTPSSEPVADLWLAQWESAIQLVASPASGSDVDRLRTVADAFPTRLLALATIRLTILGRRMLQLPDEDFSRYPIAVPQPPDSPPWRQLRAQFTLASPWLRTALRTGAALATAAAVVEIVGVSHGFWVLLGALAVLRSDTSQTLRTSLAALGGTFLGAIIGGGLLLVLAPDRWIYASLVVVTVFVAVYAQGTLGLVTSQAVFSIYVIVVFTYVDWPPDLATAAARVEDILIGIVVSLVIAVLLWPRGIYAGLGSNVVDAIAACRRVLQEAMADFIHGGGHLGSDGIQAMRTAMARAMEIVEVLVNSHAANSQQRATQWSEVLDNLRTLSVAGVLIGAWAKGQPSVEQLVPELVAPLTDDTRAASAAWEEVSDTLQGRSAVQGAEVSPFVNRAVHVMDGVDLTDRRVAERVVAAIWQHSWLHVTDQAAATALEPARALA